MEGIKNSIFKKEDVEEVAVERLDICKLCECYDATGDGCEFSGTQPCCDNNKGGCGCSLAFKIRSLASNCPLNKWGAVLSQDEEDKLIEKLGL